MPNVSTSLPARSSNLRKSISLAAGAITAIVGLLVLAGWQFDLFILKAFQFSGIVMKANTAAAFVFAGFALVLLQRRNALAILLVRFFSVMITLVGLLTLSQYLIGVDLRIDEILFREPGILVATSSPGRMAPNTALNFLMLGIAFFILTHPKFHHGLFVEFLLIFPLLLSFLGLLGYLTPLTELTGPAAYTQIAANTAVAFILLSLGMIMTALGRQQAPITIEQKLFAGFTSAATIISFISFLSVSGIQSLMQGGEWVEHTQRAKNQIVGVLTYVLEIQSGERGFLISTDDRYLGARKQAYRELPAFMSDLRNTISDNPPQMKRMESLDRLVSARLTYSDLIVSTKRTENDTKARELFDSQRGKLLADSIRVLVGDMLAEEDRLLNTRNDNEAQQATRTQFIVWSSLAVQTILLGFIFVVITKDVSGRRKAEKALQQMNEKLEARVNERTAQLALTHKSVQTSESRLAGIVNSAMDAIISIDSEQKIVLFNMAAEKIFKCTADEAIGQSIEEFIPQRFREGHREGVRRFGELGITSRSMNSLGALIGRRADGEEFPIEAAISHIEVLGQRIFTVILRDITERKRAEENLRMSETRYRTTLDHMMEGCQIIGYDWRYLYVNDVAAKQGRIAKEELIGHTMMEMYPGIDHAPFFTHLRRCMEERIPHRMENEFTFPDDSKGWFNLNMEPVPEGVFILVEDITKEKELNKELDKHREHLEDLVKERTVQLEAVNKELEMFSYSVSHDLRAPLRAIEGFSRILLEDHIANLTEEGKRLFNVVRDSTSKMAQLIDDLLAFSRVGRSDVNVARIDMRDLANRVFQELRTLEPARTIRFNIDALPEAQGDPAMIKQVWINLIANAVKFTRKKSEAVIRIGGQRENSENVYFIEDNGAGFDMRYADKLFGVFQRLHRAAEFEGTGVGLAIVQKVVHRHGGTIHAESKINEGTKIIFTLHA